MLRSTPRLDAMETLARTQQLASLFTAYARNGYPTSIAIVGNAPAEPLAARARDIDGCDLVLRVNNFVLDDPDDTPRYGRRCDVALLTRGISPARHVFQEYSRRLYLLFEPDRVVDGDGDGRDHSPEWWPVDLGMLHVPNEPFTVLSSLDLGYDPYVKVGWATTGTMAIWLAAHLFPQAELVLSGFSFLADTKQSSWSHASGEVCGVNEWVHHLDREASFVLNLLSSGRARLTADGT